MPLIEEFEEFVNKLDNNQKTKIIDDIEVPIEEALQMEGRDLEYKIFVYLKLKYKEFFRIIEEKIPIEYFDTNVYTPFALSEEPVLKPLCRFILEKSIKSKISFLKLEVHFKKYFVNHK